MILHLVNKPSVFAECIAHLATGDSVTLIEAATNSEAIELFCAQLNGCPIANISIHTIEDMNKLVELTTHAEKVVSWY